MESGSDLARTNFSDKLDVANVTPLIGPTFRSGSFVYPSFSSAGYTRFHNTGLNGQTSLHLVSNQGVVLKNP